jgi:hypothetical protein
MKNKKRELSPEQREELLRELKVSFEKNMNRHKGFEWARVQARLEANTEKLWSLGEYIFYDCSEQSPEGRRSLCYDHDALESRKKNIPENNVIDMATAMGVELLTEEEYRNLQDFGKYDTKTSSWIRTPCDIRKLGGAIFADFRYGNVFVYHNGAESYYAGRGFRGSLRV